MVLSKLRILSHYEELGIIYLNFTLLKNVSNVPMLYGETSFSYKGCDREKKLVSTKRKSGFLL